jgi:hypothetical protein
MVQEDKDRTASIAFNSGVGVDFSKSDFRNAGWLEVR